MRLVGCLFGFAAFVEFFSMLPSSVAFSSIVRCHTPCGLRAGKAAATKPFSPGTMRNHRFASALLSVPPLQTRYSAAFRSTHQEDFTTRTNISLLASKLSTFDFPDGTRPSSSSSSSSCLSSTKTYRLEGNGLAGGTRVEATTCTGHSISTDIPKSMGGGDTAPQPVETLLGAWMGCTQATASFVGRQLLLERARNKTGPGKQTKTARRSRPPRTELLLEFENIEAIRDGTGALELPIFQTPSSPSRLQRITGTIVVSLVPTNVSGSESGKSSGETSTTTEPIVLDPEELEVLKEQTEARCPIANMIVESGCAMEVEWIQKSKDR